MLRRTSWQAARGEGRWGGFPCRMKCPGRASQWARRESAAGLDRGGDGSSVPVPPLHPHPGGRTVETLGSKERRLEMLGLCWLL